MSDKEALARVKIDKLLEKSGWRLLDENQKERMLFLNKATVTIKKLSLPTICC